MRPANRPVFEDASVSDEPNKLADEATAQAESPAVAAEQPVEESVEEEVNEAASEPQEGVSLEGSGEVESEGPVDEETADEETAEEGPVVDDAISGDTVSGDTVSGDAVADDPVADDPVADELAADGGEMEVTEVEPAPEVVSTTPEVVSEASSDEIEMGWYILKVQSNREKSITAALRRKIAVEGLDEFFGDVVVPMEKVTEFKGGKKKIVERKLYPGYIVVHMHINDDTWFAVRETSGIGDFTGSGGKPTPMLPHEVARIIQTDEEVEEESPKLNISFKLGDRVKVKEGTFESFEGEVSSIDEHSGRITVMINIFGRSTPVELEYWQAEQI